MTQENLSESDQREVLEVLVLEVLNSWKEEARNVRIVEGRNGKMSFSINHHSKIMQITRLPKAFPQPAREHFTPSACKMVASPVIKLVPGQKRRISFVQDKFFSSLLGHRLAKSVFF